MSAHSTKILVGSLVALAGAVLMALHISTYPPAPIGRDAMMFGSDADTLRVTTLRTDFVSFYYAAKAAARGLNVYDAYALDSLAALDGISNHVLPYVYPPFLAIALSRLTALSPREAQQWWDVLQVSLALLSALLVFSTYPWRDAGPLPGSYWLRAGFVTVAALTALPFGENLAFGQVNIVVLFFISLSLYFYFRGKADWLAGFALAAAVLIKVTPALLAVFFLFQGRWRVFTATLAGIGLLVLATLDISGRTPWENFVQFLPSMGFARNVEGGFHPSIVANFSLAGFLMRLFPGEGTLVRLLTMFGILAMVVVLLYHHLKYRNSRDGALFVLPYLLVMLISSPVLWLHHLVYLLPGVVFTLRDFKLEKITGFSFLVVVALLVLAGLDYQSLYASVHIPETMRPVVTSLNLYLLVGAFFASVRIAASRSSLLVTG